MSWVKSFKIKQLFNFYVFLIIYGAETQKLKVCIRVTSIYTAKFENLSGLNSDKVDRYFLEQQHSFNNFCKFEA